MDEKRFMADSSANSLSLAKRLLEQHIDDIYEVLGSGEYDDVEDIITRIGCLEAELKAKSSLFATFTTDVL